MNSITFNREIAQRARQTGSQMVLAFSRVSWTYLFDILARLWFPETLISDIIALYAGFQSRIMLGSEKSPLVFAREHYP